MSVTRDVAILGVGMHPWGKWGRNFIDYGIVAAQEALADAGIAWSDVQFVAGGNTNRNGYHGFVSGSTFAEALGWNGATFSSSYAACATGAAALASARAHLLAGLADVALVVGADTAPQGYFAPVGEGERPDDRDWMRFRLLGGTNPAYFALYARRRMACYGATLDDFAAVKVKNARHGEANPNARYRTLVTAEEVAASPVLADPLRLLDICATSDGAAAVVLTTAAFAARHAGADAVRLAALAMPSPTYPSGQLEMPSFATDPVLPGGSQPGLRARVAQLAYEQAGIGPEDIDLAEVYDLSTAMELDWYEDLGLCAEGDAEVLLRSGATTIGGRIPVNPSGGLACFGEAIPAQALAQVCELVTQVRGRAGARQIEGAAVGIAVNYGLFGHASSMIVRR